MSAIASRSVLAHHRCHHGNGDAARRAERAEPSRAEPESEPMVAPIRERRWPLRSSFVSSGSIFSLPAACSADSLKMALLLARSRVALEAARAAARTRLRALETHRGSAPRGGGAADP